MFAKGSKKGTIRFSVRDGAVKKAEVAGDFNGWRPVAMKKQKGGEFVALVPAKAGACEYKFLLDGQWALDPDNDQVVRNDFGSYNSIADIG